MTTDAKNQTTSIVGTYVGTVDVGGSKAAVYRSYLWFDLSQLPDAGVTPPPGSQLTAAQIDINVNNANGPQPIACVAERVTRTDWAGYADTTYTNYKAGNAWTTLGGDVDAAVFDNFTGPTDVGAGTLLGFLAMVQDAIANRARQLHIRMRAADENPAPAARAWWRTTIANLTVTYDSGNPADERDPARLLGVRPAFTARPGRPASPARPARS